MVRFKLFNAFAVVVALVALIALASLWQLQRQSQRDLLNQGEMMREQSSRLTEMEAENIRLSNIVAQAQTPLSETQLAELRALREQVEALRRQTNQLQTLRAEIGFLRTALEEAREAIAGSGPPDVPSEDIYPRDTWDYAGNDTPEDAIQSLAFAISVGDQDSYLAGLTPDLQGRMESEFAGGDFADEGPLEMSDTTGFRIVDRDMVSPNQVVYTLYMDGEGDEMPVMLEQTNGQWLVAGTDMNRFSSLGTSRSPVVI